MKKSLPLTVLAGMLLPGVPLVTAGTFSANFNDAQVPDGTAVYGNTVVEADGGDGGTGCVKLTKSVNSQLGAFIVDDLDGGAPVNGFTVAWKMRVGGGTATPADGFSFSVGQDLTQGGMSEDGSGSGLIIRFDTYNNNAADVAPEAPSVDVVWGGAVLHSVRVPIATLRTDEAFVDVVVQVEPDGTVDVTYNGQAIYTNFNLPDYYPLEGPQFGWGARTGGLNDNHFVDDIEITTTTGERQPGFHSQPDSTSVLETFPGYFRVVPNDPLFATVQWESKAPGAANFSTVAGATDPVLRTAAVTPAMTGTEYRCVLTLNGVSITSDPAVLTVATLPIPASPLVSYEFNGGGLPAGTVALGDAQVLGSGGAGGSGYLQLTDAVGGAQGTWIVQDPMPGIQIGSFFAAFGLNMSPTDGLPADGFGFFVSTDFTDAADPFPQAEEPRAAGLSVVFDVYNNRFNTVPPPITTDDEAPSIEVYWNGALVGSRKLTPDFLDTEGGFADVRIRLEDDGTIDVAFDGLLAFDNLPIPGITPAEGVSFALAARTGGAWQLHGIDDFQLSAEPFNGSVAVVDQPDSVTAAEGYSVRFSVVTNDPDRSSYQWQRREPGADSFANIAGATEREYATAVLAAADDQAAYRCHVTSTNGTSTDSEPAVVTVVPVATLPGSPQVLLTFDDGSTTNSGSAGNGVNVFADSTAAEPITLDGGTGNSGVLHLTDAENSQSGTLFVGDFNNGTGVGAVTVSMDVRSGGGTNPPADGWGFSWSPDIADVPATGDLENGIGNHLRVAFDIWNNGTAEVPVEAPAIDIFWRGALVAGSLVPMDLLATGDGFEKVLINLTEDGKLTVVVDGVVVHRDVELPEYAGIAGGNFAITARTGGANTNQWFDNVAISTATVSALVVTESPAPLQTILDGLTATVSVAVNDPARTTYQWERQLPGGSFQAIAGATSDTYTTPALPLAENGVRYRCVCSGPLNPATSGEGAIQVVDLGLPPTFDAIFDFNDGDIPIEGAVYSLLGTAMVMPSGGVSDTPYLQLTDTSLGENSALIIEDLDGGNVVGSMVTRFFLRIGEGTAPPADGASFSWGRDIPDAGTGEGGGGTDLTVSFDTYDNVDGNPDNEAGEAPGIRLIWRGALLGSVRVPMELMLTETEFAQVVVRVNNNGTADVVYGNTVVFWNVPLPGFGSGVEGARYGWGARTGGLSAVHALDEISISTGGPAGPVPVGLIDIGVQGGNVVITFEGTLQQGGAGLSGWTTVPGAVSPFSVPVTEARQFWRALVPPQ